MNGIERGILALAAVAGLALALPATGRAQAGGEVPPAAPVAPAALAWATGSDGTARPVGAVRLAGTPSAADTLYRAARRALNAGDYAKAVELFRLAAEREPEYAADALYYQALALYKIGGRSNYRSSLAALDSQLARFPDASTRPDAQDLAIRVQAELARLGDARAAEALQREAERMERQVERVVEQQVRVDEQQVRIQRDAEAIARDAERAARDAERAREKGLSEQERATQREAELKMFALQALLESDPATARPILEKTLQDRRQETAELRRQAVFLAARLEAEPRTNDLMLDVLRNDPDPEVRTGAAHWLARSDDPRATAALREALGSGSPELQEAALFALTMKKGALASETLRDVAARTDVDPDVRAMALHGLSRDPSPENARFLEQQLRTIPKDQAQAREAVLFGLSQMPGSVSGDLLLGIAADEAEQPQIREMALFAAARSGSASPDRLGRIYRAAASRGMREQALFALTQSRDPKAIDALIEIARTETDPELRQQAIFWVGRSGDPRARELMLEVLEQ
jgi:HEAT repeat protein